jgi:type III secretion protein N (ATPase)
MLVKGAKADVIVIALIGERGREVREFIEHELGEEGRRRAVIVCATSDKSSMERAKAAYVATAIAEYFRDEGRKVLFLMDSVTRFARAQREIGLAAGEPPTRRGYPPSVFATLPKLMERVGMNDKGSITALYTVLVEGDDMTEPVADAAKGILDGHIVLSRKLAERVHYPAIDVLASISRVADQISDQNHLNARRHVARLLSAYREAEELIQIGAYARGSNPDVDAAIAMRGAIDAFLKQGPRDRSELPRTLRALIELSLAADGAGKRAPAAAPQPARSA